MKIQKRLIIVVAILFFMIALAAVQAPAAGSSCEIGSFTVLPPGTTITSATELTAGTIIQLPGMGPPGAPPISVTLPFDICQVIGIVGPRTINFAVWMPDAADWNGKFDGVGNGGLAGTINYGEMFTALSRGYATASTDTGHSASQDPPVWAEDPAFLTDFASRGIHVTAQAAKAIIGAYYGRPPRHSYFTGCSDGGGQGLFEAQRYPDDYDGIVAGAPANYPTHMWPGELYPALVTYDDTTSVYPDDYLKRLPAVNAAAVAACDGIDGIIDGIIDDPRLCHFDPATLLCQNTVDYTCLTAPQVQVFKEMYAGLKDPFTGEQIFPPNEPGSENLWFMHIEPMGPPAGTSLTYFAYMIAKGAPWDWHTFDFANPADYAMYKWGDENLGPILDAINPHLSKFKAHNRKLIQYHGWADQLIAPVNSINYYDSVVDAMHHDHKKDFHDRVEGPLHETQEFYRLFMVPGMNHCSGGPGPNTFDALGELEQWVEHGKAPDMILATKYVNDDPTQGVVMTRPLCPYPEVARWNGNTSNGGTNNAANFSCVPPGSRPHRAGND
jgi:feruloyl esterase